MAENKKSVLVYTDWKHLFVKLTDEEAGRLIKHFFAYVTDEDPAAPDRITELLFEPIKATLKRNLKSWETVISKKSEGGKKGMESRWKKNNIDTKIITPDNIVMEGVSTITDSVSVSVNVNESVSGSVSVIDKKKKKDSGEKSPVANIDFIDQLLNEFCLAYKKVHGENYEIIARSKERSAIGKILGFYKKKYPEAKSQETIDGLGVYFFKSCSISDKWLNGNMSPSMIVSKFNEINNILRNGTGNIDYDKIESAAIDYGNEQRRIRAEREKRAKDARGVEGAVPQP